MCWTRFNLFRVFGAALRLFRWPFAVFFFRCLSIKLERKHVKNWFQVFFLMADAKEASIVSEIFIHFYFVARIFIQKLLISGGWDSHASIV